MTYNTFSQKWSKIKHEKKDTDEKILFVDVGKQPETQRQINLYYYFIFIQKILKKIKASDVLEIGCGRGTMSLFLSKHLNYHTSLLDNQADAMEIAKQEFKKHDQSAEFYLADALNTNLPPCSFDAVISIGLAEHIDNVHNLFKEQFKILRPGGVIISLNIPAKLSIQYLNNIMRFFKKIIGTYKQSIRKDYYRNKLKPSDYKKIACKVGFHNIKITHVCPFPIYTPVKASTDKKIAKFNKFILKIRKMFLKYPFKTNYLFSQAHFLVGYKK